MDQNYISNLKARAEEIKNKEYTGDAGAGMVKVTMTGDMRITNVRIDHTIFAKTAPEIIDNLDFLADLFKAATSQAIEKSVKDVQALYGYPTQ